MKRIYAFAVSVLVSSLLFGQHFEWAKQTNVSTSGNPNTLVVDANGNTFTSGVFSVTTDFDPGSGVVNLTPTGGSNAYLRKLDANGSFQWVKQFSGGSLTEKGISIDLQGNIYAIGDFQGTVDFDPNAGVTNLTSTGGFLSSYVTKLSPDGNLIWAKRFTGNGNALIAAVGADASGNVFTAGDFSGTIDFNPGSGSSNLTSVGTPDGFVVKLNSNGDFVKSQKIGGFNSGGYLSFTSLDMLNNGEVVLCGVFGGTVDFDPWINTNNRTSNGGQDMFWLRLDDNINFEEVRVFGGSGSDYATDVVKGEEGYSYFTAIFNGNVNFNGNFFNSTGSVGDIVVFKIANLLGSVEWVKQISGSGVQNSAGIASDFDGNLYITGSFDGNILFEAATSNSEAFQLNASGNRDAYIAKYNKEGTFISSATIKGNNSSGRAIGFALELDSDENIYLNGHFNGSIDFDPSSNGTFTMSTTSDPFDFDNYLLKLNQDLQNCKWNAKNPLPNQTNITSGPISFMINGKIYIGIGNESNDFWEYNPDQDTWSQKPGLPLAFGRNNAVGFSIGDKGYVGTGSTPGGTPLKDFWEYNPANEQWTQLNDFGGSARDRAVGFSIGNKGYIGTGGQPGYTRDFWEYNPTNDQWNQKADFGGSARRYATGFVIKDKGYITLGLDNTFPTDVWEYDPATNTWTQKADYPGVGRNRASSFSIANKAYVGLGEAGISSNYQNTVYSYDQNANTWTQIEDYKGSKRSGATGFAIDNSGYFATGGDLRLYQYPIAAGSANQESCESYSLPGGNTTWTSSGIYSEIINSNSCDSLVTVNLTINSSSTGIDIVTACNEYTWIDGATYTSSTNTPAFLLVNDEGCDSLVTLDLNIIDNPINVAVTANSPTFTANAVNVSYQWINCGGLAINGATNQSFTATTNGDYAVVITEGVCSDTSICYTVNGLNPGTSIQDNTIASLQVSPNPTSGMLQIDLGSSYATIDIFVSNLLGQVVEQKTFSNGSKFELQMPDDKGIYFIEIKTAEGQNGFVKVVKK